ncbi:fumarylacetoacetate hydrolase family protein [Paraburkholderia caribensis]|uniref:fumarylacetoacetate hydrolase family protein n=1 Tax=Paraburkholderia caribensis TaxID=75105 RepID=UPI001CB14EEC|nr:fumarylacetoacetate hydrolase family protein [Paraburkholderia caribensis]CAG9243797.1 Ureidoglycolate lyase [Paraburkholderia caribensis]
MKFVRFGKPDAERPGVVDADGVVRDLSGVFGDISPETICSDALLKFSEKEVASLPAVSGERLGCPIANIGKVVGIGLNYREHAKESGAEIPKEPIVFLKANTSINGPFDDVILPKHSNKSDWEVELGVVIGKRTKNVSEADALRHVFGYTIVNDVSEREHQLERGGQWTKGKSHDTFCPIGPWLVTSEEVGDEQKLNLWCEVNGERYQNSNTSDMIFTVAQCVSYVSQFMTLYPGDIITTGTPHGVGLGMKPQRYLDDGYTMRLGISKLGEQLQHVKRSDEA